MRFIMALLISVSACASPAWQEICKKSSCNAIVDAGSSGSRFYIYSSDYTVLYSNKVQPGLAEVATENLNDYLNTLVPENTESIPVYFYGTAGMRLLDEQEQSARYQAVSDYFAAQAWKLEDIRTISGKEEGVYAWFSANAFQNKKQAVLEIGGASYQVSIPISQKTAETLADNVAEIDTNGEKQYVWVKSFLGLGINEVEKQTSELSSCYSNGYPLANSANGEGDINQCIKDLESMPSLDIVQQFASAKELLQEQNLSWVTLGAIRYSAKQEKFNLEDFKNQAQAEYCQENWDNVQQDSDKYAYRQCLSVGYYYASIIDGMGLDKKQMLYAPGSDKNIDWTIGFLMLKQSHSQVH